MATNPRKFNSSYDSAAHKKDSALPKNENELVQIQYQISMLL